MSVERQWPGWTSQEFGREGRLVILSWVGRVGQLLHERGSCECFISRVAVTLALVAVT